MRQSKKHHPDGVLKMSNDVSVETSQLAGL